ADARREIALDDELRGAGGEGVVVGFEERRSAGFDGSLFVDARIGRAGEIHSEDCEDVAFTVTDGDDAFFVDGLECADGLRDDLIHIVNSQKRNIVWKGRGDIDLAGLNSREG